MHWRLFTDDMFHQSMLRGVQINLVFGQDLHNRPQLQPPLGFRNTVPLRTEIRVNFGGECKHFVVIESKHNYSS